MVVGKQLSVFGVVGYLAWVDDEMWWVTRLSCELVSNNLEYYDIWQLIGR